MKELIFHASGSGRILIEKSILQNSGKWICEENAKIQKVMIVTDRNVAKLYLETVEKSLQESGIQTERYIIEPGEDSKNLTEYGRILEALAERELTRSDAVVALGGGVVGDLAGFCAASYLRGIHLIQIPTTLLACVDSSVGGKTAVNLSCGKNLAGAFYQPELVLCDPKVLETLPKEVLLDGVAETIKYGVLNDPELFRLFEELSLEEIDWEDVIFRSIRSKIYYVEEDEKDTGMRQMLNLGHTVGHAIEKCSDHKITHGHAVAIGMAFLSARTFGKGITSKECAERIRQALLRNGLPIQCSYLPEELYQAIAHDKKRHGDKINIIVPIEIGQCKLLEIHMEQMRELLRGV